MSFDSAGSATPRPTRPSDGNGGDGVGTAQSFFKHIMVQQKQMFLLLQLPAGNLGTTVVPEVVATADADNEKKLQRILQLIEEKN